jgi:Flp pilus assembly protein TadG
MKQRYFSFSAIHPCLRLLEAEDGIYLVFLAVLLIPLFFVVGLSMDSARLELDALHVQRAADAATVAATSRIGEVTDPEILDIARRVGRDNFDRNGLYYAAAQLGDYVKPLFHDPNTLSVSTHSISEPYIIGKVVDGKDNWDVNGYAKGQRRPVEIVIVADVTGSMSIDNKIEHLKEAAKGFVNNFNEKTDFISLVSYSTYLNPGAAPYYRHRQHNYPIGTDYISNPTNPTANRNFSQDHLNAAIDLLGAAGATNIQSGMIGGIEEIYRLRQLIGLDKAAAFLKVIVLITDGSPNENSGAFNNAPDPALVVQTVPAPDSSCPPYSSGAMNREDFIYPLLVADWARRNGILLFTIGIGTQAPGNTFYQGGTDMLLRPFFLRRMGNAPLPPPDPITGLPLPDPELPATCIPNYETMSNYARGEYLETPDANDLAALLQRVARSIQSRLIE